MIHCDIPQKFNMTRFYSVKLMTISFLLKSNNSPKERSWIFFILFKESLKMARLRKSRKIRYMFEE